MIKKYSTAFVKTVLCLLIGLGMMTRSASAQGVCPLDSLKPKAVKSLEVFKEIAVLNQGRIKPIESFAQNLLLLFSGKKHYQKESGIEWLARFLFAPRTTYKDKIFLINNPEILEAIHVEPDKHRRYSYHQLEPSYDKIKELAQVIDGIDEKKRSVVEQEILRVYSNLVLYIRLSGAFAFAVPHPDFNIDSEDVKALLNLPKEQSQFSFYDILDKSPELEKSSKVLEVKEQSDWTNTDKDIVRLLSALNFWTEHYANCPLGVIPTKEIEDEGWHSPMDTILTGFFDQDYNHEIKLLRDMTMHYWNGSQLEFDLAARAYNDSVLKRLSPKEKKSVQKIPLELIYNHYNLFTWAKLFYLIGFFTFLLSLTSASRILYKAAIFVTLLGFVPHLIALIFRIIIMSRPPVSNLFETFIFVGLVAAILGLIMEWINKNWLGIVIANAAGFILLTIAGKFSSDGDTMQVLVAVLDSNFWLSTHVIAITIGYAGCCVAGIMGHIYILQMLVRPNDSKRIEVTYKNMLGILGFGLTMSFLGTTLGGIWADQSWGRFWGWDPKENGALMIVIWSAIVFHARIAKIINPLGVAVGCILALINVVWAWFGVNLLSVGLHSYGFTSGIANTLAVYVLIEILFISAAVLILGQRNIKF